MNKITCKICNESFNSDKRNVIGRHLTVTHKLNDVDYIKYIDNHFDDFINFGWKRCEDCNSPFKASSNKCGSCYTKNHKINNDLYVLCKHCNIKVHSKLISQHLLSNHSINFHDYVKDNLDDFRKFGWCNCAICGNITKKQGNKHLATCSRLCQSEMMKIKYKGRRGTKHTEETKKYLSIINTGKSGMKGDLNPSKRPEVAEKISKTRIERGVAKGEKNPMYGKTHTPETIKKIFSHRPMNKLEKLTADTLDKNNIKYTFNFFISESGICKQYDFKIKGRPLILEIDGDYWHGNPKTKHHHYDIIKTKDNDKFKEDLAIKRGYKIIRLWEFDIKRDSSVIIKSINPS